MNRASSFFLLYTRSTCTTNLCRRRNFHPGSRRYRCGRLFGGRERESLLFYMDESDLIVKFYVAKPNAGCFAWRCPLLVICHLPFGIDFIKRPFIVARVLDTTYTRACLLICRYHSIHFRIFWSQAFSVEVLQLDYINKWNVFLF